MESAGENLCSVIQYYKGSDIEAKNPKVVLSDSFDTQNSVEEDIKTHLSESVECNTNSQDDQKSDQDSQEVGTKEDTEPNSINIDSVKCDDNFENEVKSEERINEKEINQIDSILKDSEVQETIIKQLKTKSTSESDFEKNNEKAEIHEVVKLEIDFKNNKTQLITKEDHLKLKENETENENQIEKENKKKGIENENEIEDDVLIQGKKRTLSEANADTESVTASVASAEDANEDGLESDFDDDEEAGNKPRKRGRCKKNPDIIPSHLSSDMVLGYKILLKFLETPQFSGFHKPFKKSTEPEKNCKITCLNQIKKKFEENLYKKVSEFVNDVREMLINIYESRNQVAIKKALRLEQILEQRIAQLPNYLRPQCALVLSSDEVNNCHNKIRITKGGGFVSLLLEKTEKKRYEKNREKRKMLAEERKQLKEEQDKDVQEWEKNVLLKDYEEDIKSMWELPAIGHFIHLCADIFNIGEVAQFEVERMLLMPQCSDTLDLIMTALLTNSLMRAKLDRTPSMPYSIWGPLVRTRVMSWYRMWHRDGRNEQKIFEEIGVEPEFWQILGPDINPLDYYYFHEISLLQRVWILKTLCDVDFVRKKTVYDNIRAQTLDELNPVHLGLDQQGNRYIQFKQFSNSDLRIYRQSTKLEGDITSSELIESNEGFEYREGPICAEKVFKDIWELNEKSENKPKKKKMAKKKVKNFNAKVTLEPAEKKNLRQSAREKQKTYVDWSDSDQSDTDLRTLRNKLLKPDPESLYRPFSDKEFISLSVFRLPREKVNKPTPKRSSYAGRKTEDTARNDGEKIIKTEPEDRKEDIKPTVCDDEHLDSIDTKQIQNVQTDFEKNFQEDDINEDDFDLREKINNCELDSSDVKFTVKNLENLKMVFKKGPSAGEEESSLNISDTLENSDSKENTTSRDKEYDALYKYSVPNHLKPDSSKFYLVVDSVEGLRQLISKFGSHENDLEIITRSTKSKKKYSSQSNTSCEIQLIEKLQNLLMELEPWELDLLKSSRSNKEKMYKEYMNFINRPPDFVHPNEAYWMKTYEEPSSTTSSLITTTTTVTTTAEGNAVNGDKNSKEGNSVTGEPSDNNQHDSSLDILGPRKRTRVTRMQLQPESDDLDEDFDDGEEYESNESDDNWVLPTPKKRAKKDTVNRTPKLPKRSVSRRNKSSPLEKSDSQISAGEKSQNSSPEKVKKTLFWGPRSTDPSEDLNWETNRQKILEQHNSPVKKLLKIDDTIDDFSELDNSRQSTQKQESLSQSVIMTSPKSSTTQTPNNKKPYFTTAQLKAIEKLAKRSQTDDSQKKAFAAVKANTSKAKVKTLGTKKNVDSSRANDKSIAPVKVQTYSKVKKAVPTQQGGSSLQTKVVQTSVNQGISVATSTSPQVVRFAPQICSVTSGEGTEQKAVGQIQIFPSSIRPQQIQIHGLGQNRVISSAANVKVQQPIQWQQKVINVQPVNQSDKFIQQPTQNLNQSQGQFLSQSQIQLQGQGHQVACLEPQKISAVQHPVQVPADKLGNFLQMVSSQGQAGTLNPDNDLYITDGKNLMKFDNNFVQQLQKDKVVSLDLKKTLLLVKPKVDSNQSASQGQAQVSTSQQNILVINKPTAVQSTASTTCVPNFVIPANYIIKEDNQQTQGDQGQQTVKIVQQSPAYVIQQKPIINKSLQPQVIKIITSQPMATNQNIILTPIAGQMIQSVNQTAVTSEQQSKAPTTLRLIRPQIATSVAASSQTKLNSVQSPLIVNNLVQIQGQRLDSTKPQTSVVAGRIVSTAVPTVRMATPQTIMPSNQPLPQSKSMASAQSQTQSQSQTVLASANLTSPQGVRSNVITQPVRMATITHGQVQTSVASTQLGSRFVVATTQSVRIAGVAQTQLQTSSSLNQTQPFRLSTSPHQISAPPISSSQTVKPPGLNSQQLQLTASQPHSVIQTSNVSPKLVRPSTTLNTQTVRLVSQSPLMANQTLVATTNATPQLAVSSASLSPQSVKIVQPQQYQTQTVVPCVNLNSQTVRLATSINSQPIRFVQSQPVRLIANNSVGVKFINRSPTPVKAAVITSAAQAPVVGVSNVRPSEVVCQPVRYQTVVQSTGPRSAQNRIQSSATKKSAQTNTVSNAPNEIAEEEIRVLGEKITEPPVTLDYINGELSVKKTSQGWKYAVKASNGKDIILTDEQIEERLKANNGVMK